ncbi:hypothetical protein GQ457_06G013010 [Hibiscus cannabinus]
MGDTLTLSEPSTTLDISMYHRLLGLIQYLTITCQDIFFVINRPSQYMHGPSLAHWTTAKRNLHYLEGTLCHGTLFCSASSLQLTAFANADWGGSFTDDRSSFGYVIYLGFDLISWKSTRQKIVSHSSIGLEYHAVANATVEVLWVQHLLQEIVAVLPRSTSLFYNNRSATYVCKILDFHSHMKHLSLDYFFVCDFVDAGSLIVQHIPSKAQIADKLTKPLGPNLFLHFRSKIEFSDGSSILQGHIKDIDKMI